VEGDHFSRLRPAHADATQGRRLVIDRDSSAKALHAKREALLDQLRAVDDAIAALASEAPEVIPTRIKSRRMLTDEHRHAVVEGRRRARHSREAAKGLAREMLKPSPKSSLGSEASSLPRLVKPEKKSR
jgi:hypothetical protein